MTDIQLTRDFYLKHDACPEGYRVILKHNLLNKRCSEVLACLKEKNEQHCVDWIETRIYREDFVREHGTIFTMKEQYRVFDPLLGQHLECVGEEEARRLLIQVSKKILETHGPKVIQVIENENGDHAWIPSDLKVNIG